MRLGEHDERPCRLGDVLAFGLNIEQTDGLQQPLPPLKMPPQDQLPKYMIGASGENAHGRQLPTPPQEINADHQITDDAPPIPGSIAEGLSNLESAAGELVEPAGSESTSPAQSAMRFDTGRWDLPFSLWVVRGVMYLEVSNHTV